MTPVRATRLAAGQVALQILHQCLHTLGIVPAVDQEQGLAAQQLKAAGPGDLGDAAVDGLLR